MMESRAVPRHNLVHQRAFSECLIELIAKYTKQQLTSAEVIAAMIALAQEVAHEADGGQHFSAPLDEDELAFCDAVAANESAVEIQGEGVLAQIARDFVAIMQRDVKTDWTARDDVKAKLRSSIKRSLVKYDYPRPSAGCDPLGDGADGVDGAADGGLSRQSPRCWSGRSPVNPRACLWTQRAGPLGLRGHRASTVVAFGWQVRPRWRAGDTQTRGGTRDCCRSG